MISKIIRLLGWILSPEKLLHNFEGMFENTLDRDLADNKIYSDLLNGNLSIREQITEWERITKVMSDATNHHYNRIIGFMTAWGLILGLIGIVLSVISLLIALGILT